LESSDEIRQKVDLLALAVQWKVVPRAPLPPARSNADLGTSRSGSRPHRQPGKEQKAPSAPIPARGTRRPLWAQQEISFFPPSLSQNPGKGCPRAGAGVEDPGTHLQRRRRDPRERCLDAGVQPPCLSKFWLPWLAPCSCHKCTWEAIKEGRGSDPLTL
jgi:hypothetical protein